MSQATPSTEVQANAPAKSEAGNAILLFILMLVAFVPLTIEHCVDLWSIPAYRFFPLLPLGMIFLSWLRLSQLEEVEPGNWTFQLLTFGVSALLVVLGLWLYSDLILVIGMICCLLSLAFAVGGWPLFFTLAPPILLLGFFIPLPFGMDRRLFELLSSIVARWAGSTLDLLNVLYLMKDSVLELQLTTWSVREATSGIYYLFAALAFSWFIAVWGRRWILHTVLLLVAAVFWVGASSLIYFVLVAYGIDHLNLKSTSTWHFDVIGYLQFAAILLMILSTDRLLLFFMPVQPLKSAGRELRRSKEDEAKPSTREMLATNYSQTIWASVVSLGLFTLLALLSVGQASVPLVMGNARERAVTRSTNHADALKGDAFNTTLGSTYELIGMETQDTNHNGEPQKLMIWKYRQGNSRVTIYLRHPYVTWNDPNAQLISDDWRITRGIQADIPQRYRGSSLYGNFMTYAVEHDLTKVNGLVFSSLINQDAESIQRPEARPWLDSQLQRIGSRALTFGYSERQATEALFQVTMLAEQSGGFNKDEQEALRTAYFEVFAKVQKLLLEGPNLAE